MFRIIDTSQREEKQHGNREIVEKKLTVDLLTEVSGLVTM